MGRATALLLAQAGANTVVLDAELDRAETVAVEIEALGRKSGALSADVTRSEAVEGAIAAAERASGGLDIVVNIVGGASWAPLLTVDETTWERDFAVNLKHHLYVGRSAARNWIEHDRPGALCVVASVSGMFSSANTSAIMSSLGRERYGIVAALLSVTRTTASVTGVATATTIIAIAMASAGYAPSLGEVAEEGGRGIVLAFTTGMGRAFLVATGLVLLALVLSILRGESELARSDKGAS